MNEPVIFGLGVMLKGVMGIGFMVRAVVRGRIG